MRLKLERGQAKPADFGFNFANRKKAFLDGHVAFADFDQAHGEEDGEEILELSDFASVCHGFGELEGAQLDDFEGRRVEPRGVALGGPLKPRGGVFLLSCAAFEIVFGAAAGIKPLKGGDGNLRANPKRSGLEEVFLHLLVRSAPLEPGEDFVLFLFREIGEVFQWALFKHRSFRFVEG